MRSTTLARSGDRIRQIKIQREAEGYLELSMPRQAIAAIARLGDPTGFDAHSLYLWGESLRCLSRYEEALVPLQQAARADSGNMHVWVALGWCFKRTGQLSQAIEALETAVSVKPEEALLHYNLACYWSLAGNKRLALRYLSRSLAIDPDYRLLIEGETDFDPIREDPEFRSVWQMKKVQR
jgi:tetratricopeptide (TPR) repeat protein